MTKKQGKGLIHTPLKIKETKRKSERKKISIPPRDLILPKPTVNGLKEHESRKEEEEQDNNMDEEYLVYPDSITEEEEYTEEANW